MCNFLYGVLELYCAFSSLRTQKLEGEKRSCPREYLVGTLDKKAKSDICYDTSIIYTFGTCPEQMVILIGRVIYQWEKAREILLL